jgi:hypothetical protein
MVVAVAVVGSALFALRDLGDGRTTPGGIAPGQIIRYRLQGPAQPIAVGEDATWVDIGAGTGTVNGLVRIDAVSGETRLLVTPGGDWPAVSDASAWLLCNSQACGGGSVVQLDPETGEIVRMVPLPGRGAQIAGTPEGVWVTGGGLSFIDNQGVMTRLFTGIGGNLVASDGSSVWVSKGPAVLTIDTDDGHVIAKTSFEDPCTMTAADGMAWVASCSDPGGRETLMGLDATGRVRFSTTIEGYGQMRYADGILWMVQRLSYDERFLLLVPLDAGTGRPAGEPFAIESDVDSGFGIHVSFLLAPFFDVGSGSVWISDFPAGEVIRIGLPVTGTGAPTPSPSPPGPSPVP